MKIQFLIPTIALPFLFVACEKKESTTEKVNSGAEKIAEGTKEIADAVAKEANSAADKAADAAKEAAAAAEEAAKKAYDHYNIANWHDTTGKPVLSWKQKINTVWFKPEYKTTPKQIESTRYSRNPVSV